MENRGVSPNVFTYNTLISCLCSYGRWSVASRLLSDMIERKINPNGVTFNALIDAFAKEGKLFEAEELYKEMTRRCICPSTVTYNSLINGFCMHDRIDEAKQMFDLMITEDCYPNVVTYNTLINGFCKCKRVESGMAHSFVRCLKEDWLATPSLTPLLSKGFFRAGDCENAQEIFKRMVSGGVPPDIWTYSILLDGFCDNGKLEKALAISNDMQNSGMEISIITYNIIIEGMCRAGKVEDAWELFCSLSLNIKRVMKPDVRTYTIMIAGFCLKRLKQEAVTLFRKIKEDGPLPNDRTYNELIRAHLRDGDKVSSAELIKEMRSCGFAAEASTFGLVTNMLHDGRLDKSFLDMLS